MFARDVISRQATEKQLLAATVRPLPPMPDMTPECDEEFAETCKSVAPVELLAPIDLYALADCVFDRN